jgi:hypothetical protein
MCRAAKFYYAFLAQFILGNEGHSCTFGKSIQQVDT